MLGRNAEKWAKMWKMANGQILLSKKGTLYASNAGFLGVYMAKTCKRNKKTSKMMATKPKQATIGMSNIKRGTRYSICN